MLFMEDAMRDKADLAELGLHDEELTKLAIQTLQTFFGRKKSHEGVPILKSELLTQQHIDIVRETQNCNDWSECVHTLCIGHLSSKERIQSLLHLIRHYHSKALPKGFMPGTVLLYYKLCKGVNIPEFPLRHQFRSRKKKAVDAE